MGYSNDFQFEYQGDWWGIPGLAMEAELTEGLTVAVYRARGPKRKYKIEVIIPDRSDEEIDWNRLSIMIRKSGDHIEKWVRGREE